MSEDLECQFQNRYHFIRGSLTDGIGDPHSLSVSFESSRLDGMVSFSPSEAIASTDLEDKSSDLWNTHQNPAGLFAEIITQRLETRIWIVWKRSDDVCAWNRFFWRRFPSGWKTLQLVSLFITIDRRTSSGISFSNDFGPLQLSRAQTIPEWRSGLCSPKLVPTWPQLRHGFCFQRSNQWHVTLKFATLRELQDVPSSPLPSD
jgi:hypothetical protein